MTETWVANVFVVNKDKLSEAIKHSLGKLANVDRMAAREWAKERLYPGGIAIHCSTKNCKFNNYSNGNDGYCRKDPCTIVDGACLSRKPYRSSTPTPTGEKE